VLTVRCPAKVNLALTVLRRRDDGFHELDTVFQAIDLWDELEVRQGDELSLTCDDPALPTDGSNLVLQAAHLLAAATGTRRGGTLHLRKSIPAQAGLGGGSSDAAGALVLLSRHWGISPSHEKLMELASELGSDVPFFLTGGTARGRGRGEQLTRLPPVPRTPLLLGFPPFGVSTAEAYAGLASRLTLPPNGVNLPLLFARKWSEEKDFSFMTNDLERVVFERWPVLERFRDALLRCGSRGALLSGSGSTVYGVFEGVSELEGAMSRLRQGFPGWTLLATRTIDEAVGFRP